MSANRLQLGIHYIQDTLLTIIPISLRCSYIASQVYKQTCLCRDYSQSKSNP